MLEEERYKDLRQKLCGLVEAVESLSKSDQADLIRNFRKTES